MEGGGGGGEGGGLGGDHAVGGGFGRVWSVVWCVVCGFPGCLYRAPTTAAGSGRTTGAAEWPVNAEISKQKKNKKIGKRMRISKRQENGVGDGEKSNKFVFAPLEEGQRARREREICMYK